MQYRNINIAADLNILRWHGYVSASLKKHEVNPIQNIRPYHIFCILNDVIAILGLNKGNIKQAFRLNHHLLNVATQFSSNAWWRETAYANIQTANRVFPNNGSS